jgi:NitT/TauT family transport system substrate-binding protein
MPIAPPRSPLLSRRGFGRLALGAVACGGGRARAQGPAPLRFGLDWRFEGPAAPFLIAEDKGYFGAEGLDVVIEPGNGSRAMLQKLAAGTQDAGFGDVNMLIRFRDENPGFDFKAVMMVYDRPGFALVGRKSRGVTAEPASLEGKKLGAPAADASFAQWPLFKTLNKIDDSKIRLEDVGFPVREPMLASGEIDAAFGFGASSYVSLKARGVPVDDIVLMWMADHGLTLYGSAVIVSAKLAAERPEAVRGLVRALMRGLRSAIAEPGHGAQLVGRRNDAAEPAIERERLTMAIEQNILTPHVKARGFGGIDPARWAGALDQLALAGAFRDRARAGDAFTEAFLPPLDERMF